MGGEFYTANEKGDFKSIILEHLKNIMNISLLHISGEQKHALYTEGVKVLADTLIPFYDELMDTAYKNYENSYKEMFVTADKLLGENKLTSGGYNNSYDEYIICRSKRLHRELYRQLNLLLKRNDYLKGSVYGEGEREEGDNEIVEVDK